MIEINLSVHEIVDFLLRSGDIDDRYFNTATMEQGVIIHKLHQTKQGGNYLSEVYLETNIQYDIFSYNITGRADGIIVEDNKITIDEIKTTNKKIEDFYLENRLWHLGQAEFYGYMYAKANNIKSISIQLTYISQVSDELDVKKFSYTFNELEEKIYGYIKEYSSFKLIINRRDNITSTSLRKLEFPFSTLRKGQEKLISASIDAATNNTTYFIQASTGIGKTISTLYGGLSGLKEKSINRIFYLTPKNSGFEQCKKALQYFKNSGIKLTSAEILAKNKVCINEKRIGKCNPDFCPYTIGYYYKLNALLKELLIKPRNFTTAEIKEIAIKNNMCPFELSLDISSYCDVITCDYNYAFNPTGKLQRYFETPDKEYRKFLLIDEAHNLVDRSKDMYTQTFSFNSYEETKLQLLSIEDKEVKKALKNLDSFDKEFEKFKFDNYLILETIDIDFIHSLNTLLKAIKSYRNTHKFLSEKYDNFSLEAYRFIFIYNVCCKYEQYFKIYITKDEHEKILITIKCLDASYFVKQVINESDGSIFFSGTLSPLDYYNNLLLNRLDVSKLSIPSPFSSKNLKVLVNKELSILYKDRDKTLKEVAIEIKSFVSVKKGNYIVYCPSFAYLEKLKNLLNIDDANVIYQDKNMTYEDKLDFLKTFETESKTTNVGICVIGGSFSEGIDLIGDKLIGVVIIGIGLPTISFEVDLQKEYYEKQGYNGYEYAYFNVGMNRVMQAAGRVIRSEDDRGAILLIDKRYNYKKYKELFDTIWKNHSYVKNMIDIKKELLTFYNEY